MAQLGKSNTHPYIFVSEDGRENNFEAIDDSQAIGLCQKKYPDQKWKLYRLSDTERVAVCMKSPQCAPET